MFIILYADDTVILANNSKDLQKNLQLFENYCETWKLTVNVSKTKVMVFGSRGNTFQNQFKWKNEIIEVVVSYKYLGLFFPRTKSYVKAKKHLIDQANKAMFSLLKKSQNLNLPIDLQIDLFNKTIKPILLYGCELWGIGNIETIERVQLK